MKSADRCRQLNEKPTRSGPVLYWMSRDQRVRDNWALIEAQRRALQFKTPIIVIVCIHKTDVPHTIREIDFILRGLQEVEAELRKKNIAFMVNVGEPNHIISRLVEVHKVGEVLCDFSPLRHERKMRLAVSAAIDVPLTEVDAHNIVPCWIASQKKEVGARTLRPKLQRLLPTFLTDFPPVRKHPYSVAIDVEPVLLSAITASLKLDSSVLPVRWCIPGESAARAVLKRFLEERLPSYHLSRNDPSLHGQSDLSPYLHAGHISAQRVALAVESAHAPTKAKEAFLEELIVRRELADNFCLYEQSYDSLNGFSHWAQVSLLEHAHDVRSPRYTLAQLEQSRTHDLLWNAAQSEMVIRGKMHGYMRMYWAKKILEWTRSPTEAMRIAITLNDRYELDGRDPNGYAGIAWSIGGVHDRPWFRRPIFGLIRYMSENGARSKFDVDAYIQYVESLKELR